MCAEKLAMLWLLALSTLLNWGICYGSENLSEVTWAHAVNSWKSLNQTLSSNDIQMIEADVIVGKLKNGNKNKIPIMGHPPSTSSDLSLEQFLTTIAEHNKKNEQNKKGIKLDYKTITAVQLSQKILKGKDIKSPVWLNADIIPGPGKGPKPKAVDAKEFFEAVRAVDDLNNATVSIGWTTNVYRVLGLPLRARYSQNHVDTMIKAIEENNINGSNHPITFPIRAAIAAESKETLHNLFDKLRKQNNVTFTIWSPAKDRVNVDKLRNLILSFGTDKVYVDVPKNLKDQLKL